MDAEGHRALRELLGSHALGLLAEDDAARVRTHLEGCVACRQLLAELTPVGAALRAVDPAHVAGELPSAPPIAPVLAHLGDELARRRRRRAGAGALAAVAAAAVAVAVLPGEEAAPLPPERALQAAAPGASGSVRLLDRFWGTQLTLEARGLPAQGTVTIWMERRGGRRVPAGTLVGLGATPIRAQLAGSVRVADAVRVGVSDARGAVLLSAPVRG